MVTGIGPAEEHTRVLELVPESEQRADRTVGEQDEPVGGDELPDRQLPGEHGQPPGPEDECQRQERDELDSGVVPHEGQVGAVHEPRQ
jgi:hypothetical protein